MAGVSPRFKRQGYSPLHRPPGSGEGRASSSTHHQHPCALLSVGLPTWPGLGGLSPGSRAGPCPPPAMAGAGQLAGGRDRPGLRLWPWDALWVGCLGGEAAPLPVPGFHSHLLLSCGAGPGRPGACWGISFPASSGEEAQAWGGSGSYLRALAGTTRLDCR